MARIINGNLNLAAFKHVKMNAKGKSGQVKGIFIPFEANKLAEHEKGGVYFNMVAFELKNPTDYGTHIVKQSFSKEVRQNMSEDEQKEQPIFGNLNVDTTPAETNNDAAGGESFGQEDKVPF